MKRGKRKEERAREPVEPSEKGSGAGCKLGPRQVFKSGESDPVSGH